MLVSVDEVTICSPFWPHRPDLGSCGAHFVGLNASDLPRNYYERPATDWINENWQNQIQALHRLVGLT